MKFRIMQTNALRGLLYEFGEVLPENYRAFSKAFPAALARAAERLAAMLIDSLREQWARAQDTDREMAVLERRLGNLFRNNPDCQKVADIPGVGLLTATATVAAIGDVRTFKSGRGFAARSVIIQGKRSAWVDGLLKRRPFNVAVAAVANKLARTIWAVLARPEKYQAAQPATA
jgi:transposase